MVKSIRNAYLVKILRTVSDKKWQTLIAKKLPVKLLFAIRWSLPKIEEAYKCYDATLKDLCAPYGATPGTPKAKDAEKQGELDKSIMELLNEESQVDIRVIDESVFEQCGEGNYDPLTFEEIDMLWWLLDDEP